MRDVDVTAVGAEVADHDMLMEAITTRLEAAKLGIRAKFMRIGDPSDAAGAAAKLEAAAEVLEGLADVLEFHIIPSDDDPLKDLRDRLAVVRRRGMAVVDDAEVVPLARKRGLGDE